MNILVMRALVIALQVLVFSAAFAVVTDGRYPKMWYLVAVSGGAVFCIWVAWGISIAWGAP